MDSNQNFEIRTDEQDVITKQCEELIVASRDGDDREVERLLSLQGVDVNYQTKVGDLGDTAFHLAAKYGHEAVLDRLLKHPDVNIDIGDNQETNLLMKAAIGGDPDIVQMVLIKLRETAAASDDVEKAMQEWLNKTDHNGATAFKWATIRGHSHIVRILADAGADLNMKDNTFDTALIAASRDGRTDIVRYLLNQPGIEYNLTNESERTAVMVAKTAEIEDLFLSGCGIIGKNNDLDVTGFKKYELIQAAAHGNVEKVNNMLTKKGVDVNLSDADGNTALMCAARENHPQVANLLLSLDEIEMNTKNSEDETALILAVKSQSTEIVKSLLQREKLEIKSKNNKRKREKVKVNSKDSNGWTALMLAVKGNYTDIIHELLRNENINVNVKTTDGKTALQMAYEAWHAEVVKSFLCQDHQFKIDITGDDRSDIARIIADAGKDDPRIWDEMLNVSEKSRRGRVFSLLILMAREIRGDIHEIRGYEVKNQIPFWQHVFKSGKKSEIIGNETVDEDGNSLFHSCARKEGGEDSIKLLQLLPVDNFIGLHERKNVNRNTMLHVAMRNGRNDVFEILMRRINQRNHSSNIYPWLKIILTEPNTDGDTVFSIAIKSEMADHILIAMIKHLFHNQLQKLFKVTDGNGNTILHLAAKFSRDDLVEYLGTKLVDENYMNNNGRTALHLAVRYNNVSTVEIFYETFKNRELDINQTTSYGETAMHIAAKIGSTEMMTLLVNLGGDYAARDEDGNTPLHHLLEFISLEGIERSEDKTKLFLNAWRTTTENSVIWWCKLLGRNLPDQDTIMHQHMTHDAMYCLRSEITNNDGLTVLEYAAVIGLPECVQIMLTYEDLFVSQKPRQKNEGDKKTEEMKKRKEKEDKKIDKTKPGKEKEDYKVTDKTQEPRKNMKPEYEIEVSNLIPEFNGKIKTTYDTRYGRDIRRILSATPLKKKHDPKADQKIGKPPHSFLETLSRVKPPMKINEEISSFPMEELVRHQWSLYQWFMLVAIVIHMAVMIWYTYESQTSISGQGENKVIPNRNSIDTTSSDFIMMLYAVIYSSICAVTFLYSKLHQKLQGTVVYGDLEPLTEYAEEREALLNYITHAVSFIVEKLPIIIRAVFTVLAILLLSFSRLLDDFTVEHYLWTKGGVILSGWIIILVQGRGYAPIYYFISVLKYIFVKNMVPFLLFYIILTYGFGCAIQLQFQLLKEETAEQQEFGSISAFGNFLTSAPYVVWELFVMTGGMDTNLKHVQNVGYLFELDRFRSFMIELLLFVYGLISTIILLNMLIAAMSATYADVIQKQGRGWRQFQVKQAIRIRNFSKSFDRIVHKRSGARQDSVTGRWYLKISNSNLKEIRAKYWTSPRDKRQEQQEDETDGDFQDMLNAMIESKVTNKVVEEIKNFQEQAFTELQRKLVTELHVKLVKAFGEELSKS